MSLSPSSYQPVCVCLACHSLSRVCHPPPISQCVYACPVTVCLESVTLLLSASVCMPGLSESVSSLSPSSYQPVCVCLACQSLSRVCHPPPISQCVYAWPVTVCLESVTLLLSASVCMPGLSRSVSSLSPSSYQPVCVCLACHGLSRVCHPPPISQCVYAWPVRVCLESVTLLLSASVCMPGLSQSVLSLSRSSPVCVCLACHSLS